MSINFKKFMQIENCVYTSSPKQIESWDMGERRRVKFESLTTLTAKTGEKNSVLLHYRKNGFYQFINSAEWEIWKTSNSHQRTTFASVCFLFLFWFCFHVWTSHHREKLSACRCVGAVVYELIKILHFFKLPPSKFAWKLF